MNDPQVSFIIMGVVGKYLQMFLYNLSSNFKVCLSNQYRFLDQNFDQYWPVFFPISHFDENWNEIYIF